MLRAIVQGQPSSVFAIKVDLFTQNLNVSELVPALCDCPSAPHMIPCTFLLCMVACVLAADSKTR